MIKHGQKDTAEQEHPALVDSLRAEGCMQALGLLEVARFLAFASLIGPPGAHVSGCGQHVHGLESVGYVS